MSKNIKSVLTEAASAGSVVEISYTDIHGDKTVRSILPEEIVVGPSGTAVVAVDKADGGTRRFLLSGISEFRTVTNG